jgi:hypothetical protein
MFYLHFTYKLTFRKIPRISQWLLPSYITIVKKPMLIPVNTQIKPLNSKWHKQGQRKMWHIPSPKNLTSDLDLWPWKSIGFQILLRTKYVPSLVKIHWRMLILDCSQGCYGRTVALLYPFATSLARG